MTISKKKRRGFFKINKDAKCYLEEQDHTWVLQSWSWSYDRSLSLCSTCGKMLSAYKWQLPSVYHEPKDYVRP